MKKLFVYGTLLQESDSEMAAFMKLNATDLGKGYMYGRLYNLGEFPGAVLSSEKDSKIFGHDYLLQNPAQVLQVLDAYEEFGTGFPEPNLFIRQAAEVCFQGSVISCWTYLYNYPVIESTRIASGDYLRFLQQR